MEFNGWGIALIAMYLVGKYGFRVYLVSRIAGAGKKIKGMIGRDNSDNIEV